MYKNKPGTYWILRYRQTINQGGQLRTVHSAEQLAPVDANHKTKRSVLDLAKERLAAINQRNKRPETVTTVGEFVERIYMPFVEAQKRPSTLKGYRDMWERHLKVRCQNVLLPDVRTCHVQRWLDSMAAEDETKSKSALSRESLKHIKSYISGIFNHAKRQGFYDGVNPVQGTAVPQASEGGDTYAYSLDEITHMLMVLPDSLGRCSRPRTDNRFASTTYSTDR
jgi:hypothetical protein